MHRMAHLGISHILTRVCEERSDAKYCPNAMQSELNTGTGRIHREDRPDLRTSRPKLFPMLGVAVLFLIGSFLTGEIARGNRLW